MKRLVVIATVAMLAFIICCSTSQAGNKLEIGPKFGLNFVSFTGDDADNAVLFIAGGPGSILRGTIGGFGRMYLNDYIAVQLELIYVQKGGNWVLEETMNDTTYRAEQLLEVEYFEIPLLLHFKVPTRSRLSPFFFGGGSIGFHTASSYKMEITGEFQGDESTFFELYYDRVENAANTSYSLIIGGGIGLDLGKHRLEVGTSYWMGLSNAFEDFENPDTVQQDKIVVVRDDSGEAVQLKTSLFTVNVQFAFGL